MARHSPNPVVPKNQLPQAGTKTRSFQWNLPHHVASALRASRSNRRKGWLDVGRRVAGSQRVESRPRCALQQGAKWIYAHCHVFSVSSMAEALRPCSSRSFLLHGGGGLSFGMTFGHTPPHPLATIEKCMCVDLHEKARVTAAPHAYIRGRT